MTPGTGTTLSYGFDASGNLTTLPTGANAATGYDDAGELTSSVLGGTTTSYAYNADGERLTAKQGTSTISSGTWNGTGELTAYDNAAADMTAATYDGNGLRAADTVSSSTQNFVWNSLAEIPQLMMDSNNAYIYADGMAPTEQVSLATGTITYLVADSLGSIRGTVNSSGSLTATTSYDAWGNPQTTGGLTAVTPFGYSGGYTDPTGLIYLLARYYDPLIGQFISVDPQLSQTLEPYQYADGNPVTNSDLNGMSGKHLKCLWYGKKVPCLKAIKRIWVTDEIKWAPGNVTAHFYFSKSATRAVNHWVNVENSRLSGTLLGIAFGFLCFVGSGGNALAGVVCGSITAAVASSMQDSLGRAASSNACWSVETTAPWLWAAGLAAIIHWGATKKPKYCHDRTY
jgi:RHS repeat-associated protein